MDHTEAVRMQAVEKYILGELTPLYRAQFEEHYFDCADCALNLRAGVAFAAASRQYFAESSVPEKVARTPRAGWFNWLKPFVAVPAFAALLFVIGYQNLVTIPHIRHSGGSADAQAEAPPSFSLVDSTVHGSSGSRVAVASGQAFDLWFDVTASPRDPNSVFFASIKNSSGTTLASLRISQVRAQSPVIFHLPAGLPEGDYKLVISDQAGGSSFSAGELPFTVAFSK